MEESFAPGRSAPQITHTPPNEVLHSAGLAPHRPPQRRSATPKVLELHAEGTPPPRGTAVALQRFGVTAGDEGPRPGRKTRRFQPFWKRKTVGRNAMKHTEFWSQTLMFVYFGSMFFRPSLVSAWCTTQLGGYDTPVLDVKTDGCGAKELQCSNHEDHE